MYTLLKAKEEIDAVARHATDIAGHVIGMADDVNAKLDAFKADILKTIEDKFAELGRKLHGDAETAETTAVHDLGAKVSLLTRGAPAPHGALPPHEGDPAHDPHAAPPPEPQAPSGEHEWNQGHQGDGHTHY